MFFCACLYVVVFFRIWWGLVFGGVSYLGFIRRNEVTYNDIAIGIYIIGTQYLIGVQPSLLG
jgi:hypothetical protein